MKKWLIPLILALAAGLLIAYFDSRPTWDDTAVTIFAVALSSGVLGLLAPDRPWLWALAVGVWTPLVEIPVSRNPASLIALVVAFAAAYAGAGMRRLMR